MIAGQQGSRLVPWLTRNGVIFARLRPGWHTAEEMVDAAQHELNLMRWLLRLGGVLMMTLGIKYVLKPVSDVSAVIPLLGNVVDRGVLLVSGLMALTIGLSIMGICWILFQPVVGLVLLGGVAVLTALHFLSLRSRLA